MLFVIDIGQSVVNYHQNYWLKYDNHLSKNYKSNLDIGYKAKKKFETEIKKYSYNWKTGGQFSNLVTSDKIKWWHI